MDQFLMSLAVVAFLSSVLPPAQYDHEPKVPVIIREYAPDVVNEKCRFFSGYRGRKNVSACAIPLEGKCFIIWPDTQPRKGPIWRHERAHCNGWNH